MPDEVSDDTHICCNTEVNSTHRVSPTREHPVATEEGKDSTYHAHKRTTGDETRCDKSTAVVVSLSLLRVLVAINSPRYKTTDNEWSI